MNIRTSHEDGLGLKQLCADLVTDQMTVVEVGSYAGESAVAFAAAAARVFCIDPWRDIEECGATADGSSFTYGGMADVERAFDDATRGLGNVIKVRSLSDDVVDMIANDSVDLVYLDSLHNYEIVLNDILAWWPKVKPGGYIGGHNFQEFNPGVISAVTECFGQPDSVYPDTSWVVAKADGRLKLCPPSS